MLVLRVGLFSLMVAMAGCGDDDAGSMDAGSDSSTDALSSDGGGVDVGSADAGSADAGSADVGTDVGSTDAASIDAGTDGSTSDVGTDSGLDECTTSEMCGGDPCFLDPDGTRDCVVDPGDPPRIACDGELCGCADDAACSDGPGGSCIAFEYRYCGGAAPPRENVCQYDECAVDADCDERAGGGCVPPGLGNFVATCAYGPCRTSADCNEAGTCELYDTGCGTGGNTFFCRYPDDECSDERPCEGPRPMICVPNEDGQGTRCVLDLPRP